MDPPDNRKLRSSMTLFHLADPVQPLLSDVLRVFLVVSLIGAPLGY